MEGTCWVGVIIGKGGLKTCTMHIHRQTYRNALLIQNNNKPLGPSSKPIVEKPFCLT